MQQYGKSREDIVKAMQLLQNPMLTGALNRVAPGMADRIRQTGEMVLNEPNSGLQNNAEVPSSGVQKEGITNVESLRDRLSKL